MRLVLFGCFGVIIGNICHWIVMRTLNSELKFNKCDKCQGYIVRKEKSKFAKEFLEGISFVGLYYCDFESVEMFYYVCTMIILFLAFEYDFMAGIIPDYINALLVFNRFLYLCILFREDCGVLVCSSVVNGSINAIAVMMSSMIARIKAKQPPIGLGDIKLLFAIGLYFDFASNQILLFSSCFLCLLFFLFTNGKKSVPFAPFIYAGFVICVLFMRV